MPLSLSIYLSIYLSLRSLNEAAIAKPTAMRVKAVLPSRHLSVTSQCLSEVKPIGESLMSKLLNRSWMLHRPDTRIHQILLAPLQGHRGDGSLGDFSFINYTNPCFGNGMTDKGSCNPSFFVVRDDLLHPFVNGNKARKLDALFPLLLDHSITDVVTCGGSQSAHAAAVAVACAERGLKSHLLLRGEQPEILTGYNLVSAIHGHVTYVPRSLYANRENMLNAHANLMARSNGRILQCKDIFKASVSNKLAGPSSFGQLDDHMQAEKHPKNVLIINEGAGDVVALLGCIRLVEYLCQDHLFGKERRTKLIVDAGTGTTAIGLGIGSLCLGLPWEVTAVMLADKIDAYIQRERDLISDLKAQFGFNHIENCLDKTDGGVVHWIERRHQRKFGNILEREIEACLQIAQQTGILVDPVFTFASWEMATQLCSQEMEGDAQVVMLHTGGNLAMFGLAQRYRSYFCKLKEELCSSNVADY